MIVQFLFTFCVPRRGGVDFFRNHTGPSDVIEQTGVILDLYSGK
jgi:hypothetical protein